MVSVSRERDGVTSVLWLLRLCVMAFKTFEGFLGAYCWMMFSVYFMVCSWLECTKPGNADYIYIWSISKTLEEQLRVSICYHCVMFGRWWSLCSDKSCSNVLSRVLFSWRGVSYPRHAGIRKCTIYIRVLKKKNNSTCRKNTNIDSISAPCLTVIDLVCSWV